MRTLEDYAQARFPVPGRVKLLRSKADPDCAVVASGAKGLFTGKGPVEVAAIRLARAPPSSVLVERFASDVAVRGWPLAAQKRHAEDFVRTPVSRSAVRMALFCWPADRGWPSPAAESVDGRAALDPANGCEFWLASVNPRTGDPDPSGFSFPLATEPSLGPEPVPYGDARFAKAFDQAVPLDESLFLGESAAQPTRPPEPPRAPEAAPPAPVAARSFQRCGDAARRKTATLERFEQWESQIRGAGPPSLDRESFTLNAAAWSGHCQELDVLRAALEQQLGCAIAQRSPCLLANGQAANGPDSAAVAR
jgi:hypothetical protein